MYFLPYDIRRRHGPKKEVVYYIGSIVKYSYTSLAVVERFLHKTPNYVEIGSSSMSWGRRKTGKVSRGEDFIDHKTKYLESQCQNGRELK